RRRPEINESLYQAKHREHSQRDRKDQQKAVDLTRHVIDAAQHKTRGVAIRRAEKTHDPCSRCFCVANRCKQQARVSSNTRFGRKDWRGAPKCAMLQIRMMRWGEHSR